LKKRSGIIIGILHFTSVLLVILFGILAIIGSSGGSSGEGDDGEGQSFTITGESGNPVTLNGEWEGTCNPDSEDGESDKSDLTVSGSSFKVNQNDWLNALDCSGSSDLTQKIGGTFTIGDEVTVTLNGSNVTAAKLDIQITSAIATVNNFDLLKDFNTDRVCGFSNWAFGVAKDILDTDCISETSQKDIIYIDDTADPDVWYSGDEGAPVDATGYPTELDVDSKAERL
jgi:hypothetical protein